MAKQDKIDWQADVALASAVDAFVQAALANPLPPGIAALAAELQANLDAQPAAAKVQELPPPASET